MFRISRLGIVLLVSLIACNLSKAQNTTKDLINLSIKYLEQNDSTAFRKTYQDIFMQYVTEALCAPFDKAIPSKPYELSLGKDASCILRPAYGNQDGEESLY